MAIKISSINIRRFYSEEELALANSMREEQTKIKDIKTLESLEQLKNNGVTFDEENDLSSMTLSELQDYCKTTYEKEIDGVVEEVEFRDKKKVARLDSFIKKNSDYIDKKTFSNFSRTSEDLKECREIITMCSDKLSESLKSNVRTRELSNLYETDLVALSRSELTDSLLIEDNTISNKIVIVTSDQEDMMRNLVTDGFTYKDKKYELYSASAGQLRKKKIMFIESDALNKAMPKLTNGLTIDMINGNKKGGVNINKWSAYLALSTSSTTIWDEVDLDRVCVVDDFETILENREVDNIDENYIKTRMRKDVKIPHTDGFGMMHPNFCRDTRMIRAPWIKGLLAPMDYRSFSNAFNGKKIIQDIWGDEYSIDDIDIILTKSQFKMHGYYKSWQDYKDKFKENGCDFRYMISESKKDLRLNALFNYQMWNTFEIEDRKSFADKILEKDKEKIIKAHSEVGSMLDMFGVDKEYNRNNHLQKALYLYPSILKNSGFKKMLKDNITARKKEMRQGRIKVNGVYTFILPDVFAWCQYLLLDDKNPKGLLADGEVSCKLVNKNKDILVNRSPHLYAEHCVRRNIKNKEHIRWFIGKGVYTSTHDMISKQLFFDVDGDIGLVVENDELVEIAKHTMKDIYPLDFKLEKASAQPITKGNIFESYNLAFGANIGYYSNLITKVLNSDLRDFDLVAKICWINNQIIDFAKTKWKCEPTPELAKELEELDKRKLPYFFIWAKDKKRESVALPNENSLVDQMAVSIDEMEERIRFNYKNIQDFDINYLLANENVVENEELITLFKKLANSKYQTMIRRKAEGDRDFRVNYVNNQIKTEMYTYCFENGIDMDEATDICIQHVFTKNRERDILFTLFGDVIVKRLESRFSELLDGGFIRCDICGKMVSNANGRALYCDKCAGNIHKKQKREWKRLSDELKRGK